MEKQREWRKRIYFLFCLVVFCGVIIEHFFAHLMAFDNMAVYAVSYKDGFAAGGFLGSLLRLLDKLLPVDMYSMMGVYRLSELMIPVCFLIFFLLFSLCLKETEGIYQRIMRSLIVLLTIFLVPFLVTGEQIGSKAVWQLSIMCLCVILIVIGGKVEWLIPILTVLGMCIGQKYLLLYGNAVVVLLFAKAKLNKQRRDYAVLGSTLLVSIGLYIYFACFGYLCIIDHLPLLQEKSYVLAGYLSNYDETLALEAFFADRLSSGDGFHNYKRMALFLLCFSPYIYYLGRFFISLVRASEKKAVYICLALGAGTVVPVLFFQGKAADCIVAVVVYYMVVMMALLAMHDQLVEEQLEILVTEVRKTFPVSALWLGYPMLFMPLNNVVISRVVDRLALILFS